MDFYKECKHITLDEIKDRINQMSLPPKLKKKTDKIKDKKEMCKLLAVAREAGTSEEFVKLVENLSPRQLDNRFESVMKREPIPTKFLKVVKPTFRFFHGRSVTRSAQIWNSSKSFKRVMWWAIDRITPLMYASTSIKGRDLDPSLRWDLYEASTKKEERLLKISKESVEWLQATLGDVKCEGKTLGWWLNKAFPIVNGKLKRISYIDNDRKMANCLCQHVGAIGYIAPEIKVPHDQGKMHKEALFCNPEIYLKLKKFSVFTTKKSQLSVERFLNGETSRITPDIVKEFK